QVAHLASRRTVLLRRGETTRHARRRRRLPSLLPPSIPAWTPAPPRRPLSSSKLPPWRSSLACEHRSTRGRLAPPRGYRRIGQRFGGPRRGRCSRRRRLGSL